MNNKLEGSSAPVQVEGRSGLIADLAFVFVVPWLVLWRLELTGASGRSMWVGWWPAVVVVVLLTAALVVGLMQRRPRGFLPYPARWTLLGAVLIFSAWIAISLADAHNPSTDLRAAAHETRASAEAELANATQATDKAKLQAVIADTEAAAKLADAIEQAAQRGGSIPRAEVGTGEPRLDPPAQEALEQAVGIAEAIEAGQALPPELAGEAAKAGLSDEKMLAALLVLAAVLLAPLLGLTASTTLVLLQALVSSGELSVGGAIKVAYALTSAALPGGGFDEGKLLTSFEQAGEMAQSARSILDAAERAGGEQMKGSVVMDVLKKVTTEMSEESRTCIKMVGEKNPDATLEKFDELLREICRDLDPGQRKSAVGARRRRKR